jgi:hypothetical protein
MPRLRHGDTLWKNSSLGTKVYIIARGSQRARSLDITSKPVKVTNMDTDTSESEQEI